MRLVVQPDARDHIDSTGGSVAQCEELHFELSRRGRLRAYWNGQGWIG